MALRLLGGTPMLRGDKPHNPWTGGALLCRVIFDQGQTAGGQAKRGFALEVAVGGEEFVHQQRRLLSWRRAT
jgi:hypothetical protein